MKHITIILAFLMTLSSPVAAQDFQKGYAAFKAGDFATALQEWKPLAEAGDAGVQYLLGRMYDDGEDIPQDYAEAVKWYRLAAEQGKARAQTILGLMYGLGQGVPQDYAESMRWYRLAADQGDAQAQSNLGAMYGNGDGVLQDNAVAHMWFNIGAANGNDKAGDNRDKIAKRMTPADISQATAMARECMSSNYKKCGY